MLKTLILAENVMEPEGWETFEVEDVCQFLKEHFGKWPDTARIYHSQVSQDNDVTPGDVIGIERLQKLEGTFYVVVYPGDPTTIIVAVLAVAAAAAAAYFLMPQVPTLTNRNQGSASPNNELSNRSNQPRPNARIPDIFGTVVSTPDLLALPYKIFENNVEVEYAYLCLGRGQYNVSAIKDDTTLISSIEGAKVAFYNPNTSPNSGDAPFLSIGGEIETQVLNVQRSNAVNGQHLKAPNQSVVKGNNNIRGLIGGAVQISGDPNADFTLLFEVGEMLTINDLSEGALPLNGTFLITAVDKYVINFVPTGNWLSLPSATDYQSAIIFSTNNENWIGPFVLEGADIEETYFNFVAPTGLYADDGDNQYAIDVSLAIEYTCLDEDGVPITTPATTTSTISGSAFTRDGVGRTFKLELPVAGPVSVRVRRITGLNIFYDGTVVDDIKWRDLYSVARVNKTHFGDVTTIQSVTIATSGALSIKDRKLNCVAQRRIPLHVGGGAFTTSLFGTNNAAEIIMAILLDPKIGNRTIAEIDYANIYLTHSEVINYFGTVAAGEFCYTFDDIDISLEETVSAIASVLHSIAYRRGSVIKLSFERETEDSVLLFNHRNKLPGTEARSIRFGNADRVDSIQLEYVSPVDGAPLTFYIPEDQSGINPKTIKTIGIRSRLQAYFHAWRAWNKVRYQNTAVEFEATQEADLLVLRDRILIANNTRIETMDGQVELQNGLELTLTQPVDLSVGTHTIFLQHVTGVVEGIGVSQGAGPNRVILANAPQFSLAISKELFAQTTYAIVGNDDDRTVQPFLLTEKTPQSNFTLEVSAVNYDERYYDNDRDFYNGLIDENGN